VRSEKRGDNQSNAACPIEAMIIDISLGQGKYLRGEVHLTEEGKRDKRMFGMG